MTNERRATTSGSDEDEDEDEEFFSLPAKTRRRIDKAFDSTIEEYQRSKDLSSTPKSHSRANLPTSVPVSSSKRRKLNNEGDKEWESLITPSDEGGGFLPPDESEGDLSGGFLPPDNIAEEGGFLPPDGDSGEEGGFMVDDDDEGPSTRTRARVRGTQRLTPKTTLTHLPLSWVPRALQLLDLPPEEDVLEVFENAASGWGGQAVGEEKGVSRKDWRAVCAVLMVDNEAGSPNEGSMLEGSDDGDAMEVDKDEADSDSEDVYSGSEIDQAQSDEELDSDFADGPSKQPTRKKSRKRHSSPSGIIQLTPRQQQGCRDAYGLFFPDVPIHMLEEQRIKVQDVSRVAQLLKEKLTKEEIMEMLELFSQAPDRSLGFREFEQMMMTCRLV